MPALHSLSFSLKKLTKLPDDLGQRLPQLEKIDLAFDDFEPDVEIDGQLESLVGSLPRLQELRLSVPWDRALSFPE